MNAETAPTGTEATTARIAQVLAEHEDVSYDLTTPRQYTEYSGWLRNCQCGRPLPDGGAPDEVFRAEHRAHVAAALSAGVIRDMQAAALREAADAWQVGGWSNVLLPQPKPPAVPVIAYSNRVLDWLRDRADRIEEAPDA